jgi:predicted transcriptional regulator of viral defense system
MMQNELLEYNKIKDYVFDLQRKGSVTFLLDEISEKFSSFSKIGIRSALRRLSDKKIVVSVFRGFYVIVPVEYSSWGILPCEWYIDDLMKHLSRPYYAGLLNAAVFYGAAHQKPQTFSIVTVLPPMRDIAKKNTRIIFISTRKEIPQKWLRQFKTVSGYVNVSAPELTAVDLITFQKEIGGLNRACTVLYELMETVRFGKTDKTFFDYVPTATIQRLGYLLETLLEQPKQADILHKKANANGCRFQKTPLKHGKSTESCPFDTKWKIMINEQIEIDDL